MSLNQRISPNLSETPCRQQAQACKQAGFTLIELMVVIAILGILAAITGGNWGSMRGEQLVHSAAEKIRSAMTATRLKALGTGRLQYVGVDVLNAKIASTIHDESAAQDIYDAAANTWAASTVWESLDGVTVQEAWSTGSFRASQPNIKVLEFSPAGGAKAKTGVTRTVRVFSKDTSITMVMIITASSVTGRVQVKQCTLARANVGLCG